MTKTQKFRAKMLSEDPIGFKAYTAYRGAHQRCNNPKTHNYKWYGAKGVKLLLSKSEWVSWYKEQMALKGFTLDAKLNVDRSSNTGNYELGNIDLILQKENVAKSWTDTASHGGSLNSYNKAKRIQYNGKSYTISELALVIGISEIAMHHRVRNNLNLFSSDRIVKLGATIPYKGELKTVAQLVKILGVSERAIRERLKNGKPVDEKGVIGQPGTRIVWKGVEYASISEAARHAKSSRTTIYAYLTVQNDKAI